MLRLLLVVTLALMQTGALAQNSMPGLGWQQGGQSAASDLPYLVINNQSGLSQERALAVGSSFPNCVLTDNGANSTLEIGWTGELALTRGGTGGATRQAGINNLLDASGIGTGAVFYRNGAGNIVSLAAGSDGQVLTLASGLPSWAGSSAGAPTDATYWVGSANGSLSAEVIPSGGTGISVTAATGVIAVDTAVVATASNTLTLTNKTLTSPILGTSLILDNGANDITLTWSSSAARAHSIPDVADASFVMSEGTQTVNGLKTFSDLKLSGTTFKTASNTITVPAATDTLVNLASSQSLSNKTIVSPIIQTQITLDQSTADYTLTFNNPAAGRAYTITDVGGSADFAMKSGSYSNGALAYGDGNKLVFLAAPSTGQYLTESSGIPAWGAAPTGFGGSGVDGAITVNSNTTYGTAGTVFQKNATTFTATGSVTLTIACPTIINCTSTFSTASSVVIDADGSGSVGGANATNLQLGSSGAGPGAGHSGAAIYAMGGGGGGFGGKGGRGGNYTGSAYGSSGGSAYPACLLGGSGGGSGNVGSAASGTSGAGGAGGGAFVVLAKDTITIASGTTVRARGSAGSNKSADTAGGGGGGSGGLVFLATQDSSGTTIDQSGTVDVSGGAGGTGTATNAGAGGGGGGGRVIRYSPGTISATGTTTLTGGAAGSTGNAAEAGGTGIASNIVGTPNLPLIAWYFEEGGSSEVDRIAYCQQAADWKNGKEDISTVSLRGYDVVRAAGKGNISNMAQYMGPVPFEHPNGYCLRSEVNEVAEALRSAA